MHKCSYPCHLCGRNMNYGTKRCWYLLFEVIHFSPSSLVLIADVCTKCEILDLIVCITGVWVWLPGFKIGLCEHCQSLLFGVIQLINYLSLLIFLSIFLLPKKLYEYFSFPRLSSQNYETIMWEGEQDRETFGGGVLSSGFCSQQWFSLTLFLIF